MDQQNQKLKWQERLFGRSLLKCDSMVNTSDFQAVPTPDALKNVQITGVYFSFANISLDSDEFIKKLGDLYDKLNNDRSGEDEKRFEVVQVVLWAHNDVYSDFENGHRNSLLGLPWFAMPFSEIDLKVSVNSSL